MKPALMAQIEVSLPVKADELVSDILFRIANKPLWIGQENRVARGISEKGNPTAEIELRFDELADRTEIASYLNKQRSLLPFLSGKILIHDCNHDEGKSCPNWQEI